jgi:hypothetical protein
MSAPVPESTIKAWKILLGELPPGDTPAAWYMSTNVEVIAAYERAKEISRKWNDFYAEMLELNELPPNSKFVTHADHFVGIVPPPGVDSTRWLRSDREGRLIPRKKTTAEKNSRSNVLWDLLQEKPDIVLPGMPQSLFAGDSIFKPNFRKPAEAVLAFLGVAPEKSSEPFETGAEWSRLKLSTFHQLRESQEKDRMVSQ